MIFFNIPSTNFQSPSDIDRFSMMWYTHILLTPLFGVLAITHLIIGDPDISSSGIVFMGLTLNLILLYTKRKFIIPGYIFAFMGSFALQVSIYAVHDSKLITTIMYLILLTLVSYYLLGKVCGTIVLLGNMCSLMIYIYIIDQYETNSRVVFQGNDNYLIVIYNLAIASFAIALVTYKIIHSMEKRREELKKANENLQAKNQEKTILLKEVHHRVKNNLQLISSLLRLQANQINNDVVETPFNEAVNRIKSMALIHEKIYENDNLSRLDFNNYLNTLTKEIIDSYSIETIVKYKIDSKIEGIEIKDVVPLAILFNELITNSLKYAFNEKYGEINIGIEQKNNLLSITYFDNGNWVAPTEQTNSFGTELIDILCEQMDGNYTLNKDKGTHYKFNLILSPKSSFEKNTPAGVELSS